MKNNLRSRTFLFLLVLAAVATFVMWLVLGYGQRRSPKASSNKHAEYQVLKDEMGSIIHIGVNWDVTEEQLRGALVTAANEHQDDPARDYLTSNILLVQVYLLKNGRQGNVLAGLLRRYVPPGNPAQRASLKVDRTNLDSFTVTLEEAKREFE